MSNITKYGAYKLFGDNQDHILIKGEPMDYNEGSISFWINVPEELSADSVLIRTGDHKETAFPSENKYRQALLTYSASYYNIQYDVSVSTLAGFAVGHIYSSVNLKYGVWYHVVISWNYSDRSGMTGANILAATMFSINGSVDSSATTSLTPASLYGIYYNRGSSSIGCGYQDGVVQSANPYSGYVTQVSFWNVKLNGTDAWILYNKGVPSNLSLHDKKYALVSWYKLNDARPYKNSPSKTILDSRGRINAEFVRSPIFVPTTSLYRNFTYPSAIESTHEPQMRAGRNNKFSDISYPESNSNFTWIEDSDDGSEFDITYDWSEQERFAYAGKLANQTIYSSAYGAIGLKNSFSVGISFHLVSSSSNSIILAKQITDNTDANTVIRAYLDATDFLVFDIIEDTAGYPARSLTTGPYALTVGHRYLTLFRYDGVLDESYIDIVDLSDGTTTSVSSGAALLSGNGSNPVAGELVIGAAIDDTASSDIYVWDFHFTYEIEFTSDMISDYLSGTKIDSILKYNSLYDNKSLSQLLGYNRMNEGSGFALSDSFTGTRPLTASGSVVWNSVGDDVGLSMLPSFLSADSIYMTTNNIIDRVGNNMTFGVRFKPSAVGSTIAFSGTNGAAFATYEWNVYLNSTSDYDIVVYISTGSAATTLTTSGFANNEDAYLVFKIDGLEAKLYTYSATTGLSSDGSTLPSTRNILTSTDMYVGAAKNAVVGAFYSGIIYDMFYDNKSWPEGRCNSYLTGAKLNNIYDAKCVFDFREKSHGQVNNLLHSSGQMYMNNVYLS